MRWLALLGLTLLTLRTPGQDSSREPAFEHIVPPGTIRSAEINDIVQDKKGLIWIAANGLFSYDGHRFLHYTSLADSGSILNQEVTCLLYDSLRNRILIGTRNLGVVVYDYETNKLRKLPAKDGTPIINHMVADANGTIWIASFNSGLFFLKEDTLRRARVKNYKSIRTSFLLPDINRIFIGDQRKIFLMENQQITDSILLRWNNIDFSAHGRVISMYKDRKGKLYVGTEKLGVLVYDFSEKKFVQHFSPEKPPFFNRINRIYEDRSGLIWMLTKAGGIVLYNPETQEIKNLTRNPLLPFTLSGDNCNAILEDRSGIIWIASTGALNKYDKSKILFRHITCDPNNPNSLSDKMVRCVYEEPDGSLIIGTDGGYLNFIEPNYEKIRRLKVTVPGYSLNFMPACIEPWDEYRLLIGTASGILVFNKRQQRFSTLPGLNKDLQRVLVRQILFRNNQLYLVAGGSFRIIDLSTSTEKIYKNFDDDTDENPVFGATTLYEDSHKRIWIGVQGGISLFNPDSTFTFFPVGKQSRRPDGSYFMVLALQEINGYLWISTFNNGIWKLRLSKQNQEKEQIERVHIPELNNNTIYCTLPDSEGMIWMTSNQGLLKYNPSTGHLMTFLPEQGVQALEFNRLAFLKSKSGAFVMGGINGINIFHPEHILTRVHLPKPVLLFATGNKMSDIQFYLNLREKSEIELSRKQNFITFHYIVNDFRTPRNYVVEYRLEGHDPDWIEATSTEISYPNLQPGNYRLRLRTRVNDVTNEASILNIQMYPPFWQRRWFIITGFLVFIALILGAFRIQAEISKRNKARLEQLLRERTAEIEQSRAELQALNEKKDLIFSILSHDLRSPLTTLKGFLTLIEENANVLTPEQLSQYAQNIRNSVSSALDLVDNTLYWALSQTGSIKRNPAYFSIGELIKKIYNLYQLTASRKRVNFRVENFDDIPVFADENMAYVALRNVVSNAIKFTPEGKSVTVNVSQNHQQAVITVKDEGIGMSREYVDRVLNQQNVAIKKGTANEKGTGLGLILCRKFIELNNGSLEIISAENQGTEFRIYLPLYEERK
ncbi:MAG: ATP-binding protein [Cyclobacteriaceae bacterium]|nr:ATP-binding protein [Cyclobacteriaceae bacterium]